VVLGGCSHPLPLVTEQTYYYWKTSLDLTQEDSRFFQNRKIQRLYVRFFDLDWDPKTGKPYARAVLQFKTSGNLPPQVVPVIYVTTEMLAHLKKYGSTADFILGKIQILARTLGRPDYPEIQMDGDWTPSTRESYFSLLKALKERMGKSRAQPVPDLSATIRLHQVKYRSQTGVPPVDRGILMVYHTSAPQELNTKNSILDDEDARDYLRDIKDYPLPLDVALPLFCWGSHFNQLGHFLKVLRIKPDDPAIGRYFVHLGGTLYRAEEDVYLGGFRYMKGDYLKVETSSPRVARDIEDWVLQEHPNHPQRVIWFNYSDRELVNETD